MLKLIDHADKAIYSIPYHKNTELVPAYVQLCVQGCVKQIAFKLLITAPFCCVDCFYINLVGP